MPAALSVSEKLRRRLSTLAGSSSFRALIARSLTLAKAQNPRLNAVQIQPDGSLECLGSEDLDAEAGVILIGELLELLVTFIGEGLVLSLVLDSWPDLNGIHSPEKNKS
jgi:hypothetical protein